MDTQTRLKNIRLFASLSPENLARVAELATRHSYPKGSVLCRQEEFTKTLYVIDSGEAILRQIDLQGIERPVGYLREGDFIGDDALLLGDAYIFCAQATTDVEALCIRKQDFDRLLEEHPQIRQQLNVRRLIRERYQAPTFSWQDADEPSLLLRRRHWLVFVRTLPIPVLALLSVIVGAWLLHRVDPTMDMPLMALFISVLPILALFWFFIDWQNDFYLVTAKRVLHREKVLLLYETWDEAPLAKIQNINIKRSFLGKMLGVGTMEVQTASSRGTMVLDHLPDPEGMQEIIFKQVKQLQSGSQQIQREEVRQELLRLTRPEEPAMPSPIPQELLPKKRGLLARFVPSRPLLRLRYEQANQITWRKHWVFLIKRIYLALPATLITVVLVVIGFLRSSAPYGIPLLLASLILWMAALFWLWWEVEDWRNDIYIVTDRSIIDIEKKPLFFAEERKEATLDMIQNVSSRMPGFLANILNYGDVLIQTAGPAGAFTFEGVSRPAEVQREVFRRAEAYKEDQQRRERERRKAELLTWFQVYHEMNQPQKPPEST